VLIPELSVLRYPTRLDAGANAGVLAGIRNRTSKRTWQVAQSAENDHQDAGFPGFVWLHCSDSVTTVGIVRTVGGRTRVHVGLEVPEQRPSCVILCAEGAEGLAQSVERVRELYPGVLILVFGPFADLSLARAAFGAGTRGFIHAGMSPSQVVRAITVAADGELVAPRELLFQLVTEEVPVALHRLSARQREILELVADDMSNAQIAAELYLSESTIKQHLRGAYKLLGVKNRTEATRLIRSNHGT
jgi:DNA-binding NarL/FixJ family response regulator